MRQLPSHLPIQKFPLPLWSLGLMAALVLPGLSKNLKICSYTIPSPKLPRGFSATLALLTDYHSGEGYAIAPKILHALRQEKPDLLLLGGDLFSNNRPAHDAYVFLRSLSRVAPTFFVTGNHEERSKKKDVQAAILQHCGILSLHGKQLPFPLKNQEILLCGLPDPRTLPRDTGNRRWRQEAKKTFSSLPKKSFTLLLSHRPEQVALYRRLPVDLILSGHAHGGQWRIPGLVNGIFSPNQGLFPSWAGGCYDLGTGQQMIVSRGLGNHSLIPRLYNPPELVLIHLSGR